MATPGEAVEAADTEQSLEDVFSDETTDTGTSEPTTVTEETTGDTEEAKAETETAPPAEEEASTGDTQTVPLTGLLDERDKRQKAEAEVAELRRQLNPETTAEPKSVFEDEKGFREELLNDVNSTLTNERLNTSQYHAGREFGKDVLAEKVATFQAMREKTPELYNRIMGSISPYHELVEIVDQAAELEKMGDVDGYRARLKAEVREELEKEQADADEAAGNKRRSITPSLASQRSTGGNSDALVEESLEDIAGE